MPRPTQKTDSEPKVYRLRDIVTQEVSLVDRAANKRRFITVKRGSMPGELVPDGNGGLKTAEPAAAPAAQTMKLTKGTREETLKSLLTTIQALTAVADVVKAAEESETDEADVSPAILDAIQGFVPEAAHKHVQPSDTAEAIDRAELVKTLGEAGGRLMKIAASLAIPTDQRSDNEIRWDIMDAVDALTGMAQLERRLAAAGQTSTEKNDPEPDEASVTKKLDLAATAETIRKALAQPAEETSSTADAEVPDEVSKVLAQVPALIEAINKRDARIRKLEDRPVGSNALPVEGQSKPPEPADVTWPRDLAAEPVPTEEQF